MPRRTLFVWDMQRLGEAQHAAILEADHDADEIIVVISHAEQALTSSQPLSAGERVTRLGNLLRPHLKSSLYLLPIKTGQLSAAQLAIRLRFDLPAFDELVTGDADLARAAANLLGCATRLVSAAGDEDLLPGATPPCRRGLLITRAQPFHLGHAACVEKILGEMDEVIVLVALSGTSHSLRNPATAGERLEMIGPFLERVAKGRHHLAAAPYESHDASNVGELQLLLPAFERIYSNSPSTRALAQSAGVPCVSTPTNVDVSGTEVRRRLIAGEDHRALLPPEVAGVLERLPVRERLLTLSQPEQRSED